MKACARARRFAGLAFVALLSVTQVAGAERRGVPVAFTFEGCASDVGKEVERIARIELHASSEMGQATTRITLACAGDDAKISVVDPLTGKRVDRTVSLASVIDRDRPRLLALALAELARSSWIELETNPTPVLPVRERIEAPAAQKEEARSVAVAPTKGLFRGDATIEAMFMPSVGALIGGASLGASRDFERTPLFVGGTAAIWQGAADRRSGAVTARQLTLDVGAGWRASRLDASLNARVGWAGLSGDPGNASIRGDTITGFIVGPEVAMSLGIVGPLRVWLRTGYLFRDVRGVVATDRDVVIGAFHASTGIGLRLSP